MDKRMIDRFTVTFEDLFTCESEDKRNELTKQFERIIKYTESLRIGGVVGVQNFDIASWG